MTTNHNHEKLDHLIERLGELNKRQHELIDEIAALDPSDTDKVRSIQERRSTIVTELIEIGTLGAEIAKDDELVAHAIEGLTDRLRDTLHEIASQLNEIPIPSTEPVADPLDQARAILDEASSRIVKQQEEILDELLPLIADQISEHFPEIDSTGIEMLGITLGNPRDMKNKRGTSIPCSIYSLRSFDSSDELVEILENEEALEALVEITKEGRTSGMNALALVLYGRVREMNGEEPGEPIDSRTILIAHPSGVISFTDLADGRERLVEKLVNAGDNQEENLEQLKNLSDRGRIPIAFTVFYASLMSKLH